MIILKHNSATNISRNLPELVRLVFRYMQVVWVLYEWCLKCSYIISISANVPELYSSQKVKQFQEVKSVKCFIFRSLGKWTVIVDSVFNEVANH